jgi:hypothetical protein
VGRARLHDRRWSDRRIELLADPTALGQLDEVALIGG